MKSYAINPTFGNYNKQDCPSIPSIYLHQRCTSSRRSVCILLQARVSVDSETSEREPTSSASISPSRDSSSRIDAATAAIASLPSCAVVLRLRLLRRGRVMNFGKIRASRSSATFVAAWRASMRSMTPLSSRAWRRNYERTRVRQLSMEREGETYLFSLSSDSNNMLPLQIIRR